MFFKFIHKISINITIYLSLIGVLYFTQNIFGKYGIIGQQFDLSHYMHEKSKYLISHLKSQTLAMNFLENKRILTPEENIAFQSSGLIHLLAVSGAQIIPICQLFSTLVLNLLYFCFRSCFHSSKLMNVLFYFKNIVVISIAFLMVGLFSCTGALLRVAFLSSLNDFLKSKKYFSFVSIALPVFSDCTVRKFIILCCASIFFGNILSDYSFLLSTIGALTVEMLALMINWCCKSMHCNKKIKNIFISCLLSFLASFLISILLYPVAHVSLLLSSFSNILAAPIVTFVITPVSLLLLFLPIDTFVQPVMLSVFDHSLETLNFIANTFQDPIYDTSIPKILLFSYEGKIYIVLLLVLLSSLADTIRSRDELELQSFFKTNSLRQP
jgi:hypothetical protein